MIIYLVKHCSIVFETGYDGSGMNVIKWFTECPVIFGVVDFELTVWWDTEVC